MQQDNSECLMMLVDVINKGSVPYCGSNDNNSTWVSLSDILFSSMLEKYIACDVRGLRFSSFEYSRALYTYITPIYISTMKESTMQGMQ